MFFFFFTSWTIYYFFSQLLLAFSLFFQFIHPTYICLSLYPISSFPWKALFFLSSFWSMSTSSSFSYSFACIFILLSLYFFHALRLCYYNLSLFFLCCIILHLQHSLIFSFPSFYHHYFTLSSFTLYYPHSSFYYSSSLFILQEVTIIIIPSSSSVTNSNLLFSPSMPGLGACQIKASSLERGGGSQAGALCSRRLREARYTMLRPSLVSVS